MIRPVQIVVLTLLLTSPRALFAQQPTPETVECSQYVPPEERNDPNRLALRGVACFEAKNYLVALRHYRRARELSNANLFNAAIGRTFQELGYPFIARRYFRDYLSGRIEGADGRSKITARLEAVEAQLATDPAKVRVESSPPGAMVFIVVEGTHWEELGETPLDVQTRTGKHRFIVEREGYITHDEQVEVGSKQDRIVRAKLVREGAAFPVSGQRLRRTGIMTMGAALPLLVAGPSLYLIGRNKRAGVEDLPPADRPGASKNASALQSWGIVASVAGVVALGTGLTLYFTGRSMDTREKNAAESGKVSWQLYTDGRTAGAWVRF